MKTELTAQELDEKYRKAKDLVEQNYWHIHCAESPLRHDPSTDVCGCRFHARFPTSVSTGFVENGVSSSGFPVNFPVSLHRIDIV